MEACTNCAESISVTVSSSSSSASLNAYKKYPEMTKFRSLDKVQFGEWLDKNIIDIFCDDRPTYSDDIRDEIDRKHMKLFGTPISKPIPE